MSSVNMIRTWRSLALISQRKSSHTNIVKTLYCSSVPNYGATNEVKKDVNINEILAKYEAKKNITANNAIAILNAIVKSNPEDASAQVNQYIQSLDVGQGKTDVLFRALKALGEPIPEELGVPPLISALKSLQILEAPLDSFPVQNIQNKLTWNCRGCSINHLNMILSFATKRRFDSDVAQKLFDEVVRQMELRWVEIEDPALIISLIYQSKNLKPQFIAKLEDKVITEAEHLDPSTITSLLKALVFGKQRPVPLIKALCYHLTRKSDLNDLRVITDGLYAASQLSIKDHELMESLCSKAIDLIKDSQQDMTSVIRSILTSLGQIGFLHKDLMDEITNWYVIKLKEDQKILDRDLLNYVVTFASLNYYDPNSDQVLDAAIKQIQVDTLDTTRRPLYVWSLAVLEKVQDQHLASVLNPDFASQILSKQDSRNYGTTQKLLYINAVAKYLNTNYQGPTIELKDYALDEPSVAKSSQTKMILNALHALASPPNFLWENVETLMGFKITAEAVFDLEKVQPIGPIQEMALLGRESGKQKSLPPEKPLPEKSIRLAVQILGFHDCLLGDLKHVSGAVSLQSRLLKARGYKVMLIRYDDVKDKHTQLQKVKILDGKLRSTLVS